MRDDQDAMLEIGSAMATFVLVHGGYHGGWCWDRLVRPIDDVVSLCAVPAEPGKPLDMDAGSIPTDDLMSVVYFADEKGRTLQTADSFVRLSAAGPGARACTGRDPIIVPGGHSVFLTEPPGIAGILTGLLG
jgi:hypothetical protein